MTPGRGPRHAVATGALALVALAGCAETGDDVRRGADPSGTTVTPAAPVELDGAWHLTAGADPAGELPLDAAPEVTLLVDGTTVGGTSACNQYSGSVTVEDDTVEVTGLGGTEMACEPAVMELEQRYLQALGGVEQAGRSGDALTLTGGGSTLSYSLDPPVVDAELTGTVWRLESLVSGESVSSTDPGGLLVLSDDGTWRASTGCGDLRGGYRLSGSTVTLTDRRARPMADGACNEQALAQHAHVAAVLSGRFEVAVDGDRLRVTAPDGDGLEFRAR